MNTSPPDPSVPTPAASQSPDRKPGEAAAPRWNPADDEEIVEAASCADDAEAAALAAALSEAGVPCHIVQGGGGVGGGGVHLGPTTEPKLWVREHDAAAAARLITDLRNEIEAAHDRPAGQPYEEE